ncbi:MAG: NUDIX domain-containing protein, partial [Selenomonadaceae bacterium]|nr:NUDIX domain-containing protein [Selenomonadaceae bacterium]
MAKGKVVQVIGPVVDIEFPAGQLPEILNAVTIQGKAGDVNIDLVVEVMQHLGDSVTRCIAMSSTDGLTRDCGLIEYPKISPAVIVAVTDGDKLLLTRYADRPYRGPALIAGFVEIGETLEDTVRREVLEEVGLHVKNIRYYKNQPWSFTDTMLVGFYCDLDGEAEIHLDRNELCEGVWMDRSELPVRENDVSLTAEMIEM